MISRLLLLLVLPLTIPFVLAAEGIHLGPASKTTKPANESTAELLKQTKPDPSILPKDKKDNVTVVCADARGIDLKPGHPEYDRCISSAQSKNPAGAQGGKPSFRTEPKR